MEKLLIEVPILGIVALLFAAFLAAKVNKQEPGTDRMKEIAAAISDGAKAFLTAVCFVIGALFSTAAGYAGMTVATRANVRTANAARTGGMNKALSIAFSGGAVMGMCVAGLGVLGVGAIYYVTKNVDVLSGFSLGASSPARSTKKTAESKD